jgi:hypothetical protein
MSKKLSDKELRELMTEQSYTIEALEDEVEYLREEYATNHARIWELICENDTLTMKYCPYRPPGDEDENIDYYDLKEENEALQSENEDLLAENMALRLYKLPVKKEKMKKAGVVSFDFWPLSDWFRFNYNKWTPGMATQLCIGPIRLDWYAE